MQDGHNIDICDYRDGYVHSSDYDPNSGRVHRGNGLGGKHLREYLRKVDAAWTQCWFHISLLAKTMETNLAVTEVCDYLHVHY